MAQTIHVPGWCQGPTGSGQGGWAAARLAALVDQPVSIAIRAPIPLDVDLELVRDGADHRVVDRSGTEPVTILEARPWTPDVPATQPVPIAEAAEARARFAWTENDHPVPHCFSCGVQPETMAVHAAPIADGRWATDWTPPAWAVHDDGSVDPGVTWAALDCTAAIYACADGGQRMAFTVQFAVEELELVRGGQTYAIVAWQGTGARGWDGRKRTAASAMFDAEGTCVAHAVSFWVSVAR